jgi:hypothetical protein
MEFFHDVIYDLSPDRLVDSGRGDWWNGRGCIYPPMLPISHWIRRAAKPCAWDYRHRKGGFRTRPYNRNDPIALVWCAPGTVWQHDSLW